MSHDWALLPALDLPFATVQANQRKVINKSCELSGVLRWETVECKLHMSFTLFNRHPHKSIRLSHNLTSATMQAKANFGGQEHIVLSKTGFQHIVFYWGIKKLIPPFFTASSSFLPAALLSASNLCKLAAWIAHNFMKKVKANENKSRIG